jgi:CRP-like cAMP-binding protein
MSTLADLRILDHPAVPVTRHAAGSTIVSQGDNDREMFLVRKGRVALEVNGRTVDEVEPGGIFGEMSLIDRVPRSATAIAVEDTEVIPIDESLFVTLIKDAPNFALDVMRVLTDRIRRTNRKMG